MKKFEELKPIYDNIFKNINGYGVSLNEKNARSNELYCKDLIYGETPFELLYALFCLEPLKSYLNTNKVFYDLGSGIGNNIIGAYLIYNFKKYVGIELLDSLYNLSKEAKNRLKTIDKNAENKIEFINKNILDVDISEADIVFFCCPSKDSQIQEEMEQKFTKSLKKGSIILSIIYVFKESNKNFKLLSARMVRTAWGEAPLLIYERVCNE